MNMKRSKNVYILGAGSVALDVISIYEALGRKDDIKGIVVEKKYKPKKNGYLDKFKIFDESILAKIEKKALLICAIGSPEKENFIKKVEFMGFKFDTAIHPAAIIGKNVKIETGTIIYPGVCITRDAKIGRHVIINVGSSVSHNCEISDYVTIGPGVDIAGHVFVDRKSFIGIGVDIINGVSIGKGVCIGAGAVVTKNIPKKVLAAGVPAKIIKKWSDNDWSKIL